MAKKSKSNAFMDMIRQKRNKAKTKMGKLKGAKGNLKPFKPKKGGCPKGHKTCTCG
tara:strand:- start:471 stop:638 length:168 start_codon:yes stop_codon:yes gene_type:complete